MMKKYLCVLRSILHTHYCAGNVTLLTEGLITEQLKGLIRNVKIRKETVFKLQLKERIYGDFLPFKILMDIPNIEAYLWNTNNGTTCYDMNALRNHIYCLYILYDMMKIDSLFKTDITNLCDFKFFQSREVPPYHIIVNGIGMDKTVKENAHFGKVM